jgi:hypothetical protein
MAISNCLLLPTLEIPVEFPTWCVLINLSANHATTHSRERWQ